jgi:PAS domain S-box-containing protein
VEQDRSAEAIAAVRGGRERQLLEGAGRLLGEIKLEERRLLASREARERESATRARRFGHLILGAAGVLLLLLTAAGAATLRSRDHAFRAMAEVRERERLYRLLADNTNDMIVRIGLDGTRYYVSPASRSLLGYDPEEMVESTPVAAIHAEDRARVVAVCQTLLSGAENPICSYRQQHRDGHYVWLEASYRLIRDDRGEPLEFVASVRDIATRQLAEREAAIAAARLQENNRLFAMAASLAHVGHWHVDLVRDEVVWADEVRRIHAVADDYVPTLEGAIDFYHADDRDRVATFIRRATEEGEAFAFTATLVRADGQVGTVTVRGQVERAPNGDIIGLFGVIQDISRQVAAEDAMRVSERMHRLLAEASTDIIVRFALDGTPLYVSPACHAVVGFTPDEMMARGAVRDIHPDDQAHVLRAWRRVVSGETTEICLYRQRRKDGGEVWLEAAYRLAGGEATAGEPEVVATVRDVSRRRRAELAMAETADRLKASNMMLAEARERAEMAARSKANFLANMSHEIRTPMNGVVGFTDLMLQGELSEDQRRRAELIADSGRSMVRLLNDILDLSKIEAGQMTVAAAPFDLAHALRACAKLVRPAIEQKGVALRHDMSESLPELVLGDGLRVRQIVLNLLGNAAKFTSSGEIVLSARVSWQSGGAVLLIGVEDTGIGIAMERQAAIFEDFVQADASITPQFGGTGLGLAISARLARLMGGELQLESELGRGSRFSLVLPLTVAQRPADFDADVMPATAPALARSAHVLVAEDHDINQLLIRDMLDRLGCSHALATDGREAVEMVIAASAAGNPFSIVLMDVQMPDVDGLEATRRIRAAGFDGAAVPIVALTANAYAEDVADCLDAGMQAHLCKPVMMADLAATLHRWGAAPAPAVATLSPSLQQRYRSRKEETLARLEALAGDADHGAEAVATVADLLHKLAGTAAMFGDAELGEVARQLEHGLGRWTEAERSQHVRAALPALRAAA